MQSKWSCDADPEQLVKKGSVLVFPFIWSWTEDREQTEAVDIEVKLDEDCTLIKAIEYVEAAALEHLQSKGANYLRQYYIEDVQQHGTRIYFLLGT